MELANFGWMDLLCSDVVLTFQSRWPPAKPPRPTRQRLRVSDIHSACSRHTHRCAATSAKKSALVGAISKASRKIRTSTTFRRPKTLRLARTPKYPRKSVPHAPRLDQFRTIISPLNTESAMKKIEEHNTLVFIVDVKANKRQISDAVNKLWDVKAAKVCSLLLLYHTGIIVCRSTPLFDPMEGKRPTLG